MSASDSLTLALKINADTQDASNNVQKFGKDYQALLNSLGKTAEESKGIYDLIVAIDKGDKSVEELDADTRKLVEAFQSGRAVAQSRDFLGLQAFSEVEAKIQQTRAAFDTLKSSGALSSAELAQAALKTQQRIDELKHSTNGWMQALSAAKDEFIKAGAAGAGLFAASKQAIEFESALANVSKTTGLSAEQTDKLGDRLKALATQLPINADGLAAIAAAGGQLGIANDQIEQFVQLAAKMASAFDIPVERAGEAVAALTNNFGLSIEQVGKLGDTINVLGNKTAAAEKDIVDALSRIGGTAKQFGLTAEQAAGLADAMLALKMPSEVASTAINALLSKLQTARVGSKDFQEGLAQLGLSADQMAAQVQANPMQALTTFLHTLEKIDKQSRTEILTQMFGEEHQDEIGRLVGALGNFDLAMGVVADKTAAAGAMQQEFEAKLKATEAQLQLAKNAIEGAAINLGQVFLPAIREVADGVKDAAAAIAEFEDKFPGITGLAATLATSAASVGALRIALLALGVAGSQAFDWTKAIGPNLAKDMGEATTAVGKVQTSFALLSAFIVGWDIGTALREKFEVFRVAGVAAVQQVTTAVEYLQYSWESYKAVFTDDTLAAATARHAQRLREQAGIFRDMYADARKGAQQLADEQVALQAATGKGHDELIKMYQAAERLQQQALASGQAEEAEKWRHVLGRIYAALEDLAKGGKKAGEDIAAGQEKATEKATTLADALSKATKEGGSGAKAIGELVQKFDLLKPDNADKLELVMRKLGATSEGAAKIVRDELAKALQDMSGPDLQARIDALRAKIQQIGPVSQEVATDLDASVREQFRRLGVDADQALTGISRKTSDAISALDGLAKSGQLNGRVLRESLSNLLNSAQTTEEVRAIISEIGRLKESGQLTGKALTDAYHLAADAQKRIGVTLEEIRAAQDRARVSADELSQAVANGSASQELMARAANDAREALRLEAAQASSTREEFNRLADAATQSEFKRAAAFNAAQTASDQAAKAAKAQAQAQQDATSAVVSGLAGLSQAWAQAREQLASYSEYRAAAMERWANQLVDTNDWSDLNWAYAQIDELKEKFDRATEAAANLGSTDLDTLRDAVSDVGANLDDGKMFDGLKKQLDEAKDKLAELEEQERKAVQTLSEARAKALADYAEARAKADDQAEKDAVDAYKAYDKAAEDAADKASKATRKAMDELADESAKVVQQFADKLAEIKNEGRLFSLDIDDAIRDIRRDGMTEDQQRADRAVELREKIAAMQKAIAEGDVAEAERLRQQVVAISESLADATSKISQEQAQREAIAYLNQIRDINKDIVALKEEQAEKERELALENLRVIKDQKRADATEILKDEMAKAAEVQQEKLDDINERMDKELEAARKTHAERMKNLREEAAQQQLAVPGLDDPAKKPDGTKPNGLEARAKGGPVKRGEDYVVTEEGPETYLDKDGNAYRLDGDGPTVWTAPDDGTVLPADARPTMTRVPTPAGSKSSGGAGDDRMGKSSGGAGDDRMGKSSGGAGDDRMGKSSGGAGDAGPRPLPSGVPDRPVGGDYRPAPVDVRTVRYELPTGPVRVLEDSAPAMDSALDLFDRLLRAKQRTVGG